MMIDGGMRSIVKFMQSVDLEAWKSAISSQLALIEANKSFEFCSAITTKTHISTKMILQNN